MSGFIELQERQNVSTWAPSQTIHPSEWLIWELKGRAAKEQGRSERIQTIKWLSIAGVLAASLIWSKLPPYVLLISFTLCAVALSAMFRAFEARRYFIVALLGAFALIYNPLSRWVA